MGQIGYKYLEILLASQISSMPAPEQVTCQKALLMCCAACCEEGMQQLGRYRPARC